MPAVIVNDDIISGNMSIILRDLVAESLLKVVVEVAPYRTSTADDDDGLHEWLIVVDCGSSVGGSP